MKIFKITIKCSSLPKDFSSWQAAGRSATVEAGEVVSDTAAVATAVVVVEETREGILLSLLFEELSGTYINFHKKLTLLLQSLLAINIKSMKTCVRLTLSRTTRP
jgi:hypothetical protein